MRCDICNARLNRGRQLLCESCGETISRLVIIQARSGQGHYLAIALAQAAEAETTPMLPVSDRTPEPALGKGQPLVPPNPYWEGSAIAGMYEVLSDGKWHSLETLKTRFNVDVERRLRSIRRRGEKDAAWNLEVLQDRVRLAPKK